MQLNTRYDKDVKIRAMSVYFAGPDQNLADRMLECGRDSNRAYAEVID